MKFVYNSISGPYQCELCQCITETKEEFVSHIQTKHLEDVDDEVLNTLNSDLKKARRKTELAQSKQRFPELHTLSMGNANINGAI